METAKDKAKSLVEKYYNQIPQSSGYEHEYIETAIECAKIAVDEIIKAGNFVTSELIDGYEDLVFNEFWQEVKNELNKML